MSLPLLVHFFVLTIKYSVCIYSFTVHMFQWLCCALLSLGQSFGAFLSPGITLELEGDSNDYVGKVTIVICSLITQA